MILPSAILFDAGGTLVTIDPDKLGDVIEPIAGERPGADAVFEAHYRAMDAIIGHREVLSRDDWWAWWLGTYLGFAGMEATDEAVTALREATGLWQRAIPGVRDAITTIRDAGIAVAVVSNADGHVAEDLAAAGFDGVFSAIIDSTVVGVSKPDPAIFGYALDALGVAAGNAWYVGDSPLFDLAGARNAGVGQFVLIDPLGLYDHEPQVASVALLPGLLGI